MKISVVTPVLNVVRFVRETIESVLSQEGDFEIEYVIRDGGSTDGTLDILDAYSDHPTVRVVSEKDRSNYDAINKGINACDGDISCWINADDAYAPGTFQAIVESFRRQPERQWLYGGCDIVDAAGREIRQPITWYKQLLGCRYSYHVLLCENYVNQPATFWTMDLWRQVDGLSLDYPIAADYHLWLKFANQSKAIVCRRKLAHFRRFGESISDTQFEQQFQDELDIIRPYANPVERAIHRFNRWKIVTAYRLMARA